MLTRAQEVKREADWFRIGFEPIFVDLSKLGCYYLIFLLVKVMQELLAYIGELREDELVLFPRAWLKGRVILLPVYHI